MNYIEAYKKKFNKEPTEDEIAIMMQSVAVEDQENAKHRSMKFKPKGFAANFYKDCREAAD